jgi:hypothetical protein
MSLLAKTKNKPRKQVTREQMFTESMMLFRSMANSLQDLSLPSYQKNMRMLTQIHSYIMEMRSFHLTLSASASGPVSVQEEPLVDLADAARAVTTTQFTTPEELGLGEVGPGSAAIENPDELVWPAAIENLEGLVWPVTSKNPEGLFLPATIKNPGE